MLVVEKKIDALLEHAVGSLLWGKEMHARCRETGTVEAPKLDQSPIFLFLSPDPTHHGFVVLRIKPITLGMLFDGSASFIPSP